MRLTLQTDYSLRVLIYLGMQEGTATISEIADFYDISRHHLTKVVQGLTARGYIHSTRGRHGGLSLARPPSGINVGDVVRATERELGIVECMMDSPASYCRLQPVCRLQGAIGSALAAFMVELDRYTLADLVEPAVRDHFLRLKNL